MEHLRIDNFANSHAFLEAHPQEFVDLLNTVLINVTSFFRDPEAWDALKTMVLPQLIGPGRGRDHLRLWSVGCATGEEAYSLAILLCELMGPAEFARRVKIYATDLDEAALNSARHASYLPRDVEGVPEDLLQKYFEHTKLFQPIDMKHRLFRKVAQEWRRQSLSGQSRFAKGGDLWPPQHRARCTDIAY